MSTIEIKSTTRGREYVPASGQNKIWIKERKADGGFVWGCSPDVPPKVMARILIEGRERRKGRDAATPAERRARMAAKWTGRMKAMLERTPATSRDLTREAKRKATLSFMPPIRVRSF